MAKKGKAKKGGKAPKGGGGVQVSFNSIINLRKEICFLFLSKR